MSAEPAPTTNLQSWTQAMDRRARVSAITRAARLWVDGQAPERPTRAALRYWMHSLLDECEKLTREWVALKRDRDEAATGDNDQEIALRQVCRRLRSERDAAVAKCEELTRERDAARESAASRGQVLLYRALGEVRAALREDGERVEQVERTCGHGVTVRVIVKGADDVEHHAGDGAG